MPIQDFAIWKEIPGFPGYEVSEHGQVRRDGKLLKPEIVHGTGRKRFGLSKQGRVYRLKAHHLVAFAFIGPSPFEGAEVCHRDGFLHNNHFSNLRWGTHASNVADAVKHRLDRREGLGRAEAKHYADAAASAFLAAKG